MHLVLSGLSAALFLASCAAPPPVAPLDFAAYRKIQHGYPYVLEGRCDDGRLLYFGAEHTYSPYDPQTTAIARLWSSFEPTLALTEGGTPPVVWPAEQAIAAHGESGLVVYLAARDGVPVESLEPRFEDELSMLRAHYSDDRIKLFYLLRQIPQYREQKSDESIDQRAERRLSGLEKRGLIGAPQTLAEVDALALPFVTAWREIDGRFFDPALEPPLAYTNDISRRLSELRDRAIVEKITRHTCGGARVFAVIGGSHTVMQEPALRSRFDALSLRAVD